MKSLSLIKPYIGILHILSLFLVLIVGTVFLVGCGEEGDGEKTKEAKKEVEETEEQDKTDEKDEIAQKEIEISIESGEGTFYPDDEIFEKDKGETIALEAEPKEGWSFDKWIINNEEYLDKDIEVTVSEDLVVELYFGEEVADDEELVEALEYAYDLESKVAEKSPESGEEVYEIFRTGWDEDYAEFLTEDIWSEEMGGIVPRGNIFVGVHDVEVLEKGSSEAVVTYRTYSGHGAKEADLVMETRLERQDDNWVIIDREVVEENT
ncbi:hypothetical protein [Natranaerofaba carboxydovora]|uniref:hypothetical protein n=1 Tax=Natranaerofaba carboxydovora TaxID=2742683 RepID=UPI001F130CA6|nr:hypothetical protein [Natranaerofaba carboxydovora]UMZ74697.1 hypothetical protein ACONDI_02297 [Natranaerofaba carboxydovora]